VKASLHLLQDSIVLHWHCPSYYGDELAAAVLEAAAPIHEVERLIWKGGPEA
jgi:hypothetical protein